MGTQHSDSAQQFVSFDQIEAEQVGRPRAMKRERMPLGKRLAALTGRTPKPKARHRLEPL